MSGRTFVEAFRAKYLEEEEEEEEDTDFGADSGIVILCPKTKPGAHTLLRQVVLDRSNITSAGDVKDIAKELQRVTELDLSANQLGSWNEVESVLKFMPNLEFLNLASSDLSNTAPPDADSSGGTGLASKPTVKVLILNATSLPWSSLLMVLSSFPSVIEVHLGLNQLSSIPAPVGDNDVSPRFKSVRKLYFNDNMVTQWSEISKLGQYFPNVENLLLVKNPLSGLTEDVGGHFTCLKQLSILDTNLSSWEEVDNLNHFPKLSEIQLRGIPLLKGLKEKISRQLVVARLPNVTKLNNTTIPAPEREDAERAFIRKFMDEPEKPKRYHELNAIHKNVHRFAQVDMTIPTSAHLTLKYKEKTDQMTVSLEQTCLQLKKSLASHFGVSSAKIRLVYSSVTGDSESEVLDTGTAHLQWYNMRDGDEIVVEENPEKGQNKQQRNKIKYSTFVDAFNAKYSPCDPKSNKRGGEMILTSKDYQNITQVVLSNMHLYGTGDCESIADKLKYITDLDISSNVLGCWTEVATMIKFMPKLEVLNLSGTIMNYIQEDLTSVRQQEQFRSVKVAILSGTSLRWPYFLYALSSLPCVEEVHFGINHLPSISPPTDDSMRFGSVRKLTLTSNILKKWSELVHVGKLFPSVESLHLGGNPLLDLGKNIGEHFPSLLKLNIQDTYLSTWEEIENLNYFPKLEHVDLKGITLFEDLGVGGKLSRQLLVARLPNIKRLDNSTISESERELSERAFVKHYADAQEKPARYAELVGTHLKSP